MSRRVAVRRWSLVLAGLLVLVGVTAGCVAKTADLKIQVKGPDGPLSGAKVVSNSQPEGQLKLTGITADDGFVTFNSIRTGNYEFTVSRFDYEPKDVSYKVVAGHMEVTVTLVKSSS